MNADLRYHALTVAEIGAWLLTSIDAPLLCIIRSDEADTPRLLPWGDDAIVDHDLARLLASDLAPYPMLARAILDAADILFDELELRWPDYAPPTRMGLITDGASLAFSPDHPWPLAPDWLLRCQREANMTDLLRSTPAGFRAESPGG